MKKRRKPLILLGFPAEFLASSAGFEPTAFRLGVTDCVLYGSSLGVTQCTIIPVISTVLNLSSDTLYPVVSPGIIHIIYGRISRLLAKMQDE